MIDCRPVTFLFCAPIQLSNSITYMLSLLEIQKYFVDHFVLSKVTEYRKYRKSIKEFSFVKIRFYSNAALV